MSIYFSMVGPDMGRPLPEQVKLGENFQVVCTPKIGSHVVVWESPSEQLILLGVVHQRQVDVSWIVRTVVATNSGNHMQRLESRNSGTKFFEFILTGTARVFLMTVPEAVAEKVSKRGLQAPCLAEEIARWNSLAEFRSTMAKCEVLPVEEVEV